MAGKGSKPRNCFSRQFRENYDLINWGRPPSQRIIMIERLQSKISGSKEELAAAAACTESESQILKLWSDAQSRVLDEEILSRMKPLNKQQ